MDLKTPTWIFILVLMIGIPATVQGCEVFEEIPPENYDRTYSNINDGDNVTRPLGFLKTVLPYMADTKPCFSVKGVNEQQVEIKFETVPSMQLCVRDLQSNYERCAEGRFGDCISLSKTSANFEFFCDVSRGCAEGDVNFWFRLTKGPLPADDAEQMWCHELNEEYPESLRPLPPNFTIRPPPPDPYTAGVATKTLSSILSFVSLFLGVFLCQ